MSTARPRAAEKDTSENVTSLVLLLLQSTRTRKGVLARLLGVSSSTLSHALRPPDSPRPRLWRTHEVVLIARHFDVSTDVLLGVDPAARQRVVERLRVR